MEVNVYICVDLRFKVCFDSGSKGVNVKLFLLKDHNKDCRVFQNAFTDGIHCTSAPRSQALATAMASSLYKSMTVAVCL